MSKIWSNALVITIAVGLSLYFVVRGVLGSSDRRLGAALHARRRDLSVLRHGDRDLSRHRRALHAAARIALHAGRDPDEHAVGSNTPLESMPPFLRTIMQASPSTHFVSFAQAILYRGAGFDVVWPQFLTVAIIGGLFLGAALLRFRRVSAQAA